MKKDFDYMQMLKGELYLAKDMAPEHRSIHGKKLAQAINNLPIENREEIVRLEKQLFGTTGEHIYVNPPLHVDYGRHVHLGENFYANMDCIFLDVNEIKIGNHVMLGPRVSLYTAGHPLDATIRNEQLEFGHPITIGDNVWLGGNVVVLPGVTIGDNVVVAAGAVVTKDIPENSLVGGNPAKLIRLLTEEDTAIWKQMKDDYYEAKTKFKTIISQEG